MPILSLLRIHHLLTPFPKRLGAHFHHLAGLRRSRIGLARLDNHLLVDIGLTRHEAETEAARPIWDAPAHWRD